MFDTDRPGSVFAAISPPADVAASPAGPSRVPLERLEAQICELAGHLAAATCRFLVLLADFDARRGWASWEMTSCAAWLAWRLEEDGSLSGTFRLPPLAGAVLLQALRAACADLAGPAVRTSSDLADGLVAVAESFLAGTVAGADDAEVYQVVIHAGTGALTEGPSPAPAAPAGVVTACPPLPEPDGSISQAHDADITADTIIPPWYGERLDLDHAIYVCFANARTRDERQRDRDDDPAGRGRVTVYEPGDCDERFRHYLEHAPRRTGPVQVPIQV